MADEGKRKRIRIELPDKGILGGGERKPWDAQAKPRSQEESGGLPPGFRPKAVKPGIKGMLRGLLPKKKADEPGGSSGDRRRSKAERESAKAGVDAAEADFKSRRTDDRRYREDALPSARELTERFEKQGEEAEAAKRFRIGINLRGEIHHEPSKLLRWGVLAAASGIGLSVPYILYRQHVRADVQTRIVESVAKADPEALLAEYRAQMPSNVVKYVNMWVKGYGHRQGWGEGDIVNMENYAFARLRHELKPRKLEAFGRQHIVQLEAQIPGRVGLSLDESQGDISRADGVRRWIAALVEERRQDKALQAQSTNDIAGALNREHERKAAEATNQPPRDKRPAINRPR